MGDVALHVDTELRDEIKSYCKEIGVEMKTFVTKGLEHYLDLCKNWKALGAEMPPIVSLYEQALAEQVEKNVVLPKKLTTPVREEEIKEWEKPPFWEAR